MTMTEGIGGGRDRDAFMAEVANLMPSLRSLAKLLYRNEESAADLTQETLAKAWAARGSFAPGTNLRAWLFTIMRNQFRSEARRGWRQMPWDEEAAERIPAAHAEQNWALELRDTVRAMRSLSERQREALILVGVGGLSSEDTAIALDSRPTAVKSRVSRARRAVHAMLDGAMPLKAQREKGDVVENLAAELARLNSQAVLRENRA